MIAVCNPPESGYIFTGALETSVNVAGFVLNKKGPPVAVCSILL